MLVGSYSSNVYGIPRATKDADVVIQKLRWGRSQGVADATNVLAVQSESPDWFYITHWTDQPGTTDQLNELRESL